MIKLSDVRTVNLINAAVDSLFQKCMVAALRKNPEVERTCNAQASDDCNWLETHVLELRLQTVRPDKARFALHVFSPASLLNRTLGTVADIVQCDGVACDGKQNAKDAGAAAIEHLTQSDAELLSFVLGDGMPCG
jgi:hypothetical protein